MKKSVFLMLALALAILQVSAFDQPYMKAAKTDLNQAMNSLRKATPDKGGHRENAIGLVSRAITAVTNGINYDESNPNNRRRRNDSLLDESSQRPVADQPNMKAAKEHLEAALANLEKATADKGGFRVDAMRLVREAIDETQKGIDYDRQN